MNTYREIPSEKDVESTVVPAKKVGRKKRFAGSISKILNGEFLTKEGLIDHLPFITFLAVLFILHISLMYFFENTQRDITKKGHELNELRSQFNTTMSELETKKQQSNVATNIEAMGLKELRTPPQIIDVQKGFMSGE